MARHRKCPKTCALGNSCKWKTKMLQQVPPLKCPYFFKNVSSFMLWRPNNHSPRMELPADFVREHGDKFNEIVRLKGPCKRSWNMRLRVLIMKYRRVMMERGWKGFSIDFDLNMGDHLLFALTAFSQFKVYLFDDVGVRKRTPSSLENQAGCGTGNKTGQFENTEKGGERFTASPLATSLKRNLRSSFSFNDDQYPRDRDSFDNTPQHGEVSLPTTNTTPSNNTTHLGSRPCKDKSRGSPAGTPVIELSDDQSSGPRESANTGKDSEVESEAAHSFEPSQKTDHVQVSPKFLRKLPSGSIKHGMNGAHLEIPATFANRYQGLFNQRVRLQGPTGRIWPVMCRTSEQQQYERVNFKAGWLEFAEDNKLRLNDRVLLTHIAHDHFLVEIVAKASRKGGSHQARTTSSQDISEQKQNEGDALSLPEDQTTRPDEPSSQFQKQDNSRNLLKSKVYQLQQQLLAQRKPVYKHTVNGPATRRGRMEWRLGHS